MGILALGLAAWIAAPGLQSAPEMTPLERYRKAREERSRLVVRGDVSGTWTDGGKRFVYRSGGGWKAVDTATGRVGDSDAPTIERPGRTPRAPRGAQATETTNSDGKWKALYRDHNVVLLETATGIESAITTEGSAEKRVKYGNGSWAYSEELEVREAMWFSPDTKYLAFYRFDENGVTDLALDGEPIADRKVPVAKAYPRAGETNAKVDLYIQELRTGRRVRVKDEPAEYQFGVRWSPDGKELLFYRTDRLQTWLELVAANPATGDVRVILRETAGAWVDITPRPTWVGADRLIWRSERSGFANLELWTVSGKKVSDLTKHRFDVDSVVRVTDDGWVFYTARSAPNPYLRQLHRVRLDGTGEERLTSPQLSHTIDVAPDGKSFVQTSEDLTTPPVTVLRSVDNRVRVELGRSDVSRLEAGGYPRVEHVEFVAADGKTKLYGSLHRPRNFDAAKKTPLVVPMYAGPDSGGDVERFATPDPLTELGFAVARFEVRGGLGRGRAFRDAVYGKLGVVEIDDLAAGVRAITSLPGFERGRVAATGTSYGGYAALMCLVRHPDLFGAAVASSSVTDWRYYDTIYTERYMKLPQTNRRGYDEGSVIRQARRIRGRMMLFYGTVDDNVHPVNTLHLMRELDRLGRKYEVVVGQNQGHTGVSDSRWVPFLVSALRPEASTASPGTPKVASAAGSR